MATQIASLEARIGANVSGLDAGLRKAQRDLKATADAFQHAGRKMTLFITLPTLGAATALTKMAMDAQESENLFSVAMGGMEDAGRAWSKAMKDAYGVSEYNARKYLGTLNMMVAGMGLSEDAAFTLSKQMTELAYDLASVYNVSNDEALLKLQAGLAGETEPLRRWGVTILEETVKAWAFKEGLIGINEEMTQQQRVIARAGLIMEQTAKQSGDLARTLDSPANQLRIVQERFHDAAIEAGQVFLPAVSEALGWLNDTGIPAAKDMLDEFIEKWPTLSDEARRNIIAVGGLFVAGGPFMEGIGLGLHGVALLLNAFGMLPSGVKKAVVASMLILMPLRQELADLFDTFAQMREFQVGFGHKETWARDIANALRNPIEVGVGAALDLGEELLRPLLAQAGAVGNEFLSKYHQPNNKPTEMDNIRDELATLEQSRKAAAEAAEAKRKLAEEFNRQSGANTADNTTKQAKALDTLKGALDAAGLSQSEYIAYLVSQHPATIAAAQAVEALGLRIQGLRDQQEALNASMAASQQVIAGYQRQIHDLNLAQEALGDQVRAGQDALSALQDKAAGLGAALSDAKAKLADLSRPKLKGMGEAEDQAAWIERQKKRVEYAKKNKMSMEEVLKLFPYLSDAEAEFSENLPTSIRLLDKMAEALSLKSALEFDEALRQIAKTAGETEEELTFDEAIAQIGATKEEINRLGSELSGVNVAIAAQQEYLKGLSDQQAELDKQVRALNEAIYQEQQHIVALQEASALYEKQIETLQTDLQLAEDYQDDLTDALADAYEWILEDKAAMGELGAETVLQAGVVDEAATSILTAFTGLVDQEVAQAKAAIDGLVAHFNAAKAAMAGGLPSTGGTGTEGHAIGGIVGGPMGRPQLIIAHGGERVQTVAERASGGGEGVTFNYQPTIYTQQAPDPVREYHVARALLG